MSVETYYKQGPIRENGGSGVGAATLKLLISDLLSLDPMLLLDSVEKDNVGEYSCYLKIVDSRLGYKIRFSGGTVYIYTCYLNSSNKWTNIASYSSYFLNGNSKNCATAWGIGDCFRYFSINSNLSEGYSIGGEYALLNSETYNEKIVLNTHFGFDKGVTFPVSPILTGFPGNFYNTKTNSIQQVTMYSFVPDNASVRSGFVYTLQPFIYKGYSPTEGFLNITFGEGHKLYKLYNGTNGVTANPGEMVTIDGKQVMSVGQILYAE